MKRIVCVAVLMFLLSCGTAAFAATYYMATNGSDSYPGTISQPWATFSYAVQQLAAGDTLNVRAGTYNQGLNWTSGPNGAPGQYITIQAYDGDRTATLTAQSSLIGRQYVKVIGFEMIGGYYNIFIYGGSQYIHLQRGCCHDSVDGDTVKSSQADYITVEDCEIYRAGGDAPSGNNQGIDFLDVDYAAFRNNYIHDSPDCFFYAKGGSEDCVAEGNVLYNGNPACPGPAIYLGQQSDRRLMDGATYQSYNMVVRNNIVTNVPGGAFSSCDNYHGYVYNNTVVNCGNPANNYALVWQRTQGSNWTPKTTGMYVFNNLFLDTRGQMPSVYRNHSGVYEDWQHDYNSYYNNGSPIPVGDWAGFDPNQEPHSTFGNPNLANASGTATTYAGWLDCYRITAASTTLIDKGTSSAGNTPYPAVTLDMEGVSRPQGSGWDIGAFEYSSGPTPPVANFTGNPTSGSVPLTVLFTDTSAGSPTSWSWTFGDGGASAAENPSHTYNSANSYTVSLTATNSAGSDGETKANYITAVQAQDYTCASLTVNNGTIASGDHTSVHTSDNVYLVITAAKAQNKYTAQVSYTFNTGLGSLSSLTVTEEGKVSTGTQPLTVYAYNYSTSTWTSIATGTLTTTDSTVSPTVSNPSQYISGGTVQVRVKAGGTGSTAFSNSTDLVRITAAP